MSENKNNLTIFMSQDGAFIAKPLKNGQPSKVRRQLTEQEIMSFVTWFIKSRCEKLGADEFTLNMNGKPAYKLSIIKEGEE